MTHSRGVLLAAAVAGLLSPHVAHATLIWEANPSRGLSVFEGLERSPGTIDIVSDPKGQFGQVFHYNITDNPDGTKDRCESRGHKLLDGTNYTLTRGNTYYVGWRALWDGNVGTQSGKWVALWQMHAYGGVGMGAPFVIRTLGDGQIHLQNNVVGTNVHIWSAPLVRNQWHRFVLYTHLDHRANVGWVEFWYNGQKQTFINGQQRFYCPTHEDDSGTFNKLKWGLYRTGSATGSWHAWMSRARIATTFEEADPDGGTPSPTPTPTPSPTTPPDVTPTSTPTPTPTPTSCSGCGFSGYYRIMARHSGKAVVVQSASTANSANVVQWTYGGSNTNDEWRILDIGGGYHRIINRLSGKDMVVQSASTAEGGNIIQYTYGGAATNDEWAISDAGGGYYTITNRNSGKVVNVAGAGTANGAAVQQASANGGTHQQFQIVSIP